MLRQPVVPAIVAHRGLVAFGQSLRRGAARKTKPSRGGLPGLVDGVRFSAVPARLARIGFAVIPTVIAQHRRMVAHGAAVQGTREAAMVAFAFHRGSSPIAVRRASKARYFARRSASTHASQNDPRPSTAFPQRPIAVACVHAGRWSAVHVLGGNGPPDDAHAARTVRS